MISKLGKQESYKRSVISLKYMMGKFGRPSSAFVDESDTNLILALNIDWYSCYGWSVYSTGAIYISILNLPLRLRNSRSSLLLVGLMPGEYSIMTGIHTK
jgi:hypothetical protein